MAETAVKERPISFTDEMVRAILAGHKTQTRRHIKPQPIRQPVPCQYVGWALEGLPNEYGNKGCSCSPVKCPYWIGHRLWVQERYSIMDGTRDETGRDPDTVFYRADQSSAYFDHYTHEFQQATDFFDEIMVKCFGDGWQRTRQMPRWASRINLEITDVRAERLQDISESDALSEGVVGWRGDREKGCKCGKCAIDDFAGLWEKIHGAGSWAANPWVWVVGFKRVESSSGATDRND